MASNISPIEPLILAYISAHGKQCVRGLSKVIPYSLSTIGRAAVRMVDKGALAITAREKVKWGSLQNWFDLPGKKTYPHIGASEYLGWHPTGTRPRDIKPAHGAGL